MSEEEKTGVLGHRFLPKGDFPEIKSVTKGDRAARALGSAGELSTIQQQPARIGIDVATDADVTIGDMERRNGLYILGRPRMGKSWLIVNLILQDIKKGYGVFFLDPHGDAIDDVLNRIDMNDARSRCILLDPEDEDYSFGINLLACSDIKSAKARNDAFARAKGVFDKLWKSTFEEKPWLQLILQNTIYAFIENQEFTLTDFPNFFSDPAFRDYIVGNMKYNLQVKDYWTKTFASKTKYTQDEQMEAAQTRVEILLGHPYVRSILGETKTTIDFGKVMEFNRIVLLRLSTALPDETKKIIGTILVGELLHAIERRPENDRHQFCAFVDEFQNFASFQDFATLITRAPKLNVATTLCHHDRYGQLADNKEILGATADIANIILFQIAAREAADFAPELADKPPTEIRREEKLSVSQNPVSDLLLRGHDDPEIRKFVNKYLRFLEDKRDDIKADMEGAKFARMIELDTAAFFGAVAQEEGIAGPYHYASQARAVAARQSAILGARMHAVRLDALHKQENRLRVTLRGLNRFLTEVMEGEKRAGQEAFSDFLIDLAAGYSALPEAYAEALGLYIKLSYGDPGKHRAIPFDLARSQGLFSQEVAALTFQAEKKTEEERRKFQSRYIIEEEQNRAYWRMRERESKPWDRLRAMEGRIGLMNRRRRDIRGGRTGAWDYNRREDLIWYPANVYTWYMWLRLFPDIEKLVIPYRTGEFTQTWKDLLSDGQAAKTIGTIDEKLNLVKAWEYGSEKYMRYMRARVARDLKEFLHRYQEGALVMLALVDCAGKGGWRVSGRSDDISVSELPGIKGKDPVEVWCLVERLRILMREALGERKFSSLFIKYLDRDFEHSYDELDDRLDWAGFQTTVFLYPVYECISYRKDVQSLETLLTERWGWFVRHHSAAGEWWKKISAPVRYYLLCRAADLISFGDKYSSLPPAAFTPYEELVSALVWLSKDTKARLDEAEEKEQAARERKLIEEECAEKVRGISYSPPALLEARVLDGAEIRAVKNACIKEINEGPKVVYEVAATIDEFARFCVLLAKPENLIKVRTGQFIEREVPMRQEVDMVNEVVRLLTRLPKYTAYAKILQGRAIWKGEIQTTELSSKNYSVISIGDKFLTVPTEKIVEAEIIQNTRLNYCKKRTQIEEEIQQRQISWKAKIQAPEKPAPSKQPDKKAHAEDEPPPNHY